MNGDPEGMSSPENNQNQARLRETKAERSARTRKALLKATLASLAENGYAGTSTTDVVKRAGLSRGALAHHFPSKAQLVAEAAAYLINKRIESTSRMLRNIDPDDMSIETWMRIQWEAYEKWFPANIEFMVAARTDKELRKHFSKAIAVNTERAIEMQVTSGPELSSSPNQVLTNYVKGCFIRGLCLERIVNPDSLVNEIFEEFVRIMNLAFPETPDDKSNAVPEA